MKLLNKPYKNLYFISISLILSCSTKPTSTEMEKQLTQQIEKESNSKLKLVHFEIESEQEVESFGNERYIAHFNSELEVIEDCWMTVDHTKAISGDYRTYDKQPTWLVPARYPLMVKKGQKLKIKGSNNYVKTEEGWVKEQSFKLF